MTKKTPDDEVNDLTAAEEIRDRLAMYIGGKKQHGLISDKMIRPGVEVESTADVALMRKVAMAFCDLSHIVQDVTCRDGVRPANTHERLARAGISPQQYSQMVQHPEFPRIVNRTSIEFVVLPRLPQVQAALLTKSEGLGTGSEKAARVLFELARLTELPTLDDMRREYATLDEDGWRKRIREETEGAIKLLDEIEGREMLNESLVVP